MATRRIIEIDRDKCVGCGLCTKACHESAIALVDGKAKLLRDDYCDGLGNCLPACPVGAIKFVEREAAAYDKEAVQKHKESQMNKQGESLPCGCPGSESKKIQREESACGCAGTKPQEIHRGGHHHAHSEPAPSALAQWPVQIQLAPVNAPYFAGAKLLVAADCSAYAFGDFHDRFMRGHVTLIGCPKLDHVDYSEKLTAIIRENDIKSVTIVRMSVPCCGGLEHAVKTALQNSGKFLPWQIVTISTDGKILD